MSLLNLTDIMNPGSPLFASIYIYIYICIYNFCDTYFFFLIYISCWKEYDPCDSSSFDYEPDGTPIGSYSKGKLLLRSYIYILNILLFE